MKAHKYIAWLISITIGLCDIAFSMAQNLVPNPSFETYTACPPNLGYIMYCPGWEKPQNHMGSPDYYNTCAQGTVVYVQNNFLGGQMPASGNAYAGIILKNWNFMNAPTYREYLQSHLSAPMAAGQIYSISFKCSLGDYYGTPTVTTNALNIYISNLPAAAPAAPNYTEPMQFSPQFNSNITFDTSSWTTVEFNYTATGGEEYILLGNFKLDSTTYASPANTPQIYAFIDDVSVRPADILISGNQPICPGENLTLTASQSLTYAWANANSPNTIISTSPSITVSPTTNTTYYVYGNADTGVVTVQMKIAPNINLGNDTVACAIENLLLIAYNGGAFQQGVQYLWNTGNTTPFLTPTQSGIYWVQGALNGCLDSDTIHVIINPNPTVSLGPDQSICLNDSIILNATNSNAIYEWQDGFSGATYTVHGNGTFYVNASIGNCITSDTIHITDAPMPVLDLGNDISVCAGTTVILTADNSNDAFLWNNNSTGATLSPTTSGLYWVQAILGNCSANDSVNVTFFSLPHVDLGNDTMSCLGSTVVLDAASPNLTYHWQDDSQSATYSVNASGVYHVQVTDTNQCSDSDSIQVVFVTMPVVNFYDSTICTGQEWKLDVTTLGGQYLWQDQSSQPTFLIEREGSYWVQVNNACGTVSDTTNILYERCDCYFFVPNSLTSDDDGHNETFHVVAKNGCDLMRYNISIYNRWGNMIYQSENIETDWIPKNAPLDIYNYRINYQFEGAPTKQLYGHITLLR